MRIRVEGTAYQRTLEWLFQREMRNQHVYWPVEAVTDRRAKRHRIVQALSGIASKHLLYVHPSMKDFIDQFSAYPVVKHDDHLDSAAMAVEMAIEYAGMAPEGPGSELGYMEGTPVEYGRLLSAHRSAP